MNNNNSFNNQPNDFGSVPNKNNSLSVVIIILFFIIGLAAGYFLFNKDLFKKNNVETNKTNVDNNEQKDEKSNTGGKESETSQQEVLVAQPRADLKLLKKIEHDITLNNKILKYVAFYYENNNRVAKEIYLNGKLLVDVVDVSVKSGNDSVINEDNNNSFGKISYLKDTSNGKNYIVYFYDFVFMWGASGNEFDDYGRKVLLIDDNANVLFNKETFSSKTHYSLMLDNKAEALDRTIKEYDSIIEVYGGDDFGKEASRVEFKDDHFYSLELVGDIIYDYKYVVTNGVLNKTLLKQYNFNDEKHVNAAGA